MLTLEKILASAVESKLRAVPIQTPEIEPDSIAHIAELTAEQRDELEVEWGEYRDTHGDGETGIGFRAFVVAYCLCDADRKPFVSEPKERAKIAKQLQAANARAINRMFSTAARINGLTKSDEEELLGKSQTPPSGGGSGESPSPSGSRRGRRGSAASAASNTPSSEPSAA